MDTDALTGGFTDAPIDAARSFRAALTAMAMPGRTQTMAGARAPAPLSDAAAALVLTLCDPDTPLYLAGDHDSTAIRDWITFHTGAPLVPASRAIFALGRWAALQPLSDYAIGTSEYPDRSATLIVECDGLKGANARLSGPGIDGSAAMLLPELGAFQNNRGLFPLGLDFYFTAGRQLTALPRSTMVEAI
ncbi:MAG: phosphonate C-P lyase system protein PhnH [Pseudomonadota bacterium]